MSQPLKAMILAAGFGTRLRPITNTLPKPLVPIAGIPLIFVTIKRLALMQVDEIFVNGHYLWEKLHAALETIPFPHPPITFSQETPEILGTAGGIGAIRKFLNGEDLLILSSDIVTDFDIEGLIAAWTGIPLTKIYSVLKSLEDKSVVKCSPGKPRIYRCEAPTEVLNELIRKVASRIETLKDAKREQLKGIKEITLPTIQREKAAHPIMQIAVAA